jgi:oxygen-independent coproporphyrinogen-3 oxidase
VCGSEILSGRDIFNESVMLGLRTVAGVDVRVLDPLLLEEVSCEIRHHLRCGNLVREGDKIKIPSGKLFVSDGIIRDLFI